MLLPTLLVFSALSIAYAAVGPTANLEITNQVISPDGYSRSSILAGGTFPGALITGNKNDRFELNVVDSLTDSTMLRSTSIHWHGLFQKNSSWADGSAFVTQCPIIANNSFLYNFSAPGQAGTFWYHSHLSTQYCDGLRGALVIYDPDDPLKYLYDVDNESTVITLADWYHFPAPQAPLVPAFNSTLINGLGHYPDGPSDTPLAVITVTQGKRYRFRLVSISCDPNWVFSIHNHTMTIIEADGVSTEPYTVDSLQIFAGQRYSFVLNATQAIDNYWIRAVPNSGNTSFTNDINSAILRYSGAASADPVTPDVASLNAFVETSLHPYVDSPVPGVHVPGGADVNLQLAIEFNFSTFRFTINGASFVPPTVPVLLQILSGAQTAQDLLPSGSVYTLPPNKVIEINIPGGSTGNPHPMHLHGHNFWVIKSAGNSSYNFDNPVVRDVVNTGVLGDNATFRFVTGNAGPWFLHCHINWHLELGLAVVMAEDPGTIATESQPAAWDQLCPDYNSLNSSQL